MLVKYQDKIGEVDKLKEKILTKKLFFFQKIIYFYIFYTIIHSKWSFITIMDKAKIFIVKAALTLLALSFVSCSSTEVVTTRLRTDIESSGLQMNNNSFRYYIDRDVELKASTTATKVNKGGEGVQTTVKKTRSYVLITDGTAGICKEAGGDWLKVAFEPDFPGATIKFVKTTNGDYKIHYTDNGLIVYNGTTFQIQSKPTYWYNRFLSIFSDANGRNAKLKINYDVNEEENVKNRKAKGY